MKTLVLAVLMAGAATGALAADLPTHKAPMAPAPAYGPPPFTWGGLYVGINGGFGYDNLSNTNFGSAGGGLIGGTIGYNWQVGQIVFGGEADLDYGFLKNNNTFAKGTTSFQSSFITTERLRLGYAADRALFYITGGYAGISTQASIADAATGFTGTQNGWRSGGVIGGGVEYAFTNNITAKAEYLWAPMEDRTYWSGPDQETNRMSLSLVRLGVNYKF